jgi:hypothetical protein
MEASLKDTFAQLKAALNIIMIDYLRVNSIYCKLMMLSSLEKKLRKLLKITPKIEDFDSVHPHQQSNEYEIERIKQKFFLPLNVSQAIINDSYYFMQNCKDASQNILNIFGKASIGKTHLACRIAQQRIDQGLPVILLLGKPFAVTPPLERQLLQILDIPQSYSWDNFIQALQSAAKAYRTKIPIIIDGLDDSLSIDIWKK